MARFSLGKAPPPIVLLTDFGYKDSYVGIMKGVMRRICREADILDLSHNIMPQDVAEAAFVLSSAYRYFPDDAIFVCVVDPGVGSERAVLCMRKGGQTFLAPDNGLLSIIAEATGYQELREVTETQYFLKERSATFHGRDVFAPVAAHLAEGVEPQKLGPARKALESLHLPRPVRCADGSLRGEIIYIDHFGNLITNIRRATLDRSFGGPPEQLQLRVKRRLVPGIRSTYADGADGELLALVGSSGHLEVAVNGGSAARMLGCEKGDSVSLMLPAGATADS
ncbi:MAG: SAM-dependent chlorinase/fluorinase [Candidatus Brocadiaceae bacterium]|nr:SAM-dependent chlorinase/fluorinase [Candidatus Brocadiaceae bacterium]